MAYQGYGSKKRSFPNQPVAKRARWAYSSKVTHADSFTSDVRDVVCSETKRLFRSFAGAPIRQDQPLSFHITPITQGLVTGQRIGNWVQPVALDSTIIIRGNEASIQNFFQCRVGYLIYHVDNSDDPFDAGTILESAPFPCGSYKISQKDKFTVLWDKYVSIVNHADNSQFVKTLSCSVDLGNCPQVLYEDDKPKMNQIFFFAMSDSSPVDDEPLEITQSATFMYTDA